MRDALAAILAAVSIVGGEAGNLVLKVLEVDGFYLVGGIADYLRSLHRSSRFLQ